MPLVAAAFLLGGCGGATLRVDARASDGADAGPSDHSGAAGAGAPDGAAGAPDGAAGAPVDAAGDAGGASPADAASDAGLPSAVSDAMREALPIIPCDVACPGGPCPVRAGGPTVIATGPFADRVAAFAVGPSDLYYGTISKDIFKRGQLRKVSLSTGADTLVADAVQVSQIHLDTDGTVYFVADQVQSTAVRVLTVAGAGPPMPFLANDYAMPNIVPRSGLVIYESAFTGGGLIAQQKPDSYELIAEFSNGVPHGLAVDDTKVYWTNGDGPSRLQSFVRNSISYFDGAATVLTTADDLLVGPLVDGADLYFAHQHAPGSCAGSVMTVPTSGGTPRLVSLGSSGSDVSSFAVDDAFVYWTTPDAGGFVFRAAKGGAMPEVIAAAQPGATAVAVDATRVYWIAAGAHGDEVRAITK
jgi:hypothetical protein